MENAHRFVDPFENPDQKASYEPEGAGTGTPISLGVLRQSIADLDRQIVSDIAQRIRLCEQAALCKSEANAPMVDPAQEAKVVRSAADQALENGIDAEAIRDIYWRIIEMSRKAQEPW